MELAAGGVRGSPNALAALGKRLTREARVNDIGGSFELLEGEERRHGRGLVSQWREMLPGRQCRRPRALRVYWRAARGWRGRGADRRERGAAVARVRGDHGGEPIGV